MNRIISFLRKTFDVCKLVPLLPVTILLAIPVALAWNWRPWSHPFWFVDPSVGQWLVILLVAYTVIDTLRGMIDDIRHGHVGVDIIAIVALLSTLAVREYWASWAIALMIYSGEAIEEYAHAKATSNLTALMKAAPVTAHVVRGGERLRAARSPVLPTARVQVPPGPTPALRRCRSTKCSWATCSWCCLAKPCRWTVSCSRTRPRST